MTTDQFITHWKDNDLSEKAGAQQHFNDLCELLDVEKPRDRENYCFERGAKKSDGSDGWADVWKRGYFGWENKKPGRDLNKAYKQLTDYAGKLDNPPLLVVCDRERIIIHTAFTGYPDEVTEIRIDELTDASKLQKLRWVFTDVEKFRPEKSTAAITAIAAGTFADLAKSMRDRGLTSDVVAHFLVQCLFCMFAEDENVLPGNVFTELLKNALKDADKAAHRLGILFTAMQKKAGGMYGDHDIPWFNGGLFKTVIVPDLTARDLSTLYDAAADMDWRAIDPTIFGTLFERGLDPHTRAPLGAHYTDTETIGKLIKPLISEPLLSEWKDAKSIIEQGFNKGVRSNAYKEVQAAYNEFLNRLKNFRVLDPACGSGNFLYLALKALRDVEKQVHLDAQEFGFHPELYMITGPHNILGIEKNEYAAELARVTVWIGDIQWCRRNGRDIAINPILKPLDSIEQRDALITLGGDEATWPKADVIIGNPPFLGGSKMLGELGEQYVEKLRKLYKGRVPGGADLVTYWFEKSRAQIESGQATVAGLVATNSIRGGSNRKVLDRVLETAPVFAAWSDEPWVNEGAAVRVSLICFGKNDDFVVANGIRPLLTVGENTNDDGVADKGARNAPLLDGKPVTEIYSDLTAHQNGETGFDLTTALPLAENKGVCIKGSEKGGPHEIPGTLARQWLTLPSNPNGKQNSDVIRPWANGMDIARRISDTWIIDFYGMKKDEAALFEVPFEYIKKTVAPVCSYEKWWLHRRSGEDLRTSLAPLKRFIATPRVSKHRLFVWMPAAVLLDSACAAIARQDDTTFGILHSRFHELWSLRMGTSLEDRPRYTPTTCFETFPFPVGANCVRPPFDANANNGGACSEGACDAPLQNPHFEAIAVAARRLDELRENWLNPAEWVDWVITPEEEKAGYPKRPVAKADKEADLKKRTLTNLYNARPAWLDMAHKTLDKAVAAAYGWSDYSPEMPDETILGRLLVLNLERAKETL
jgi:type II restriction/modification system DNA methylase subunit YeeA